MNFKIWIEHNELILPDLFQKLKKINNKFLGVHFSKNNEISFNPKPFHNDPLGIYCFPKKYILNNNLIKNKMFSNYNNIFLIIPSENAKILNLNMSENKAKKLLKKMNINQNLLNNKEIYHNSTEKMTFGHKFWGVLEHIKNKNNMSRNYSWNKLFKKTEYNVLYDSGLGIIHSNEPSQIVYLEPNSYKIIDVIYNYDRHKILYKIANLIPNTKIHKQKQKFDKSTNTIILKNDNYSIYISNTNNNLDEIYVQIYGFNQDFSERFTVNNKKELLNLTEKINNFLQNSNLKEKYVFDNDVIQKISNYYNIKYDNNYPLVISKKYKNSQFTIRYSPNNHYQPNDKLFFELRNNDWLNKYFYYDEIIVNDKNNPIIYLNSLLDSIQEKIKKDNNNYNSRYALDFLNFLKNRVFKKRTKNF